MKVYSTSYFKVYHKDFEGIWDYLISETPLNFGAIEGLLQLNYKERIQILEIIERSNGVVAIDLGGEIYGFELCFIAQEEGVRHYRLLDAKFEDISTSEIEIRKSAADEKREERKRKFQENMKKAGKWKED